MILSNMGNICKICENDGRFFAIHTFTNSIKRVKADKDRAYIIVTINEIEKSVKTEWRENLNNIEGIDPKKELLKVEIPTKQPQTRKQYEKSKQLWPCHFHEDKRLEAVLGKTLPEVWGDKAQ